MTAIRALQILWAAPISVPAVLLAFFNMMAGGKVRRHGIALEATGGALGPLLNMLGPRRCVAAITLGHVVLARNEHDAERWRTHEHAHVRQYERWGMLFPFAYGAASLFAWGRGHDAYCDNVFEIEARAAEVRVAMQARPTPPQPARTAVHR